MSKRSRTLAGLVVLSVLALSGCGAGRSASAPGAAAPSVTTPGGSVPATGATGNSGAPRTTASRAGTGPTRPPASTRTPVPGSRASGPGPTAAPVSAASPSPVPAGLYRYDTTGSSTVSGGVSSTSPEPPVTTIRYDRPDATSQHSFQDMRDAHGNGSTTDTILDYRPDGIHLLYVKVTATYSGITQSYAFTPSPAPLVGPTGAPVGYHVSFTMSDGTTTAQVILDVLAHQAMSVGGSTVSTAEVRTVTHLSGQVNGQSTSLSWNTLDDGLAVKEQNSTDVEVGLDHFSGSYTATLQSLRAS